ncbi:hypothetical protein MHYP_G00170680 [Metynnis hypsauchen]
MSERTGIRLWQRYRGHCQLEFYRQGGLSCLALTPLRKAAVNPPVLIMSPYIQAFVLSLATWAVILSATVGSSAVLPCDWRHIATTESASQTPHVVSFAGTVFGRRGPECYQGEGYEDRVDIPEDHLLKGDCSLE